MPKKARVTKLVCTKLFRYQVKPDNSCPIFEAKDKEEERRCDNCLYSEVEIYV